MIDDLIAVGLIFAILVYLGMAIISIRGIMRLRRNRPIK